MSMQMERRFRGRGIWQLRLMKLNAAILESIMLAVVLFSTLLTEACPNRDAHGGRQPVS